MERLSVIRKVSTDGYKLLTIRSNHALYSDENERITLGFSGQAAVVPRAALSPYVAARLQGRDVSASIRDLLADSLCPITESEPGQIVKNAPVFFSAYAPQATWQTIMPGSAMTADTNLDPTAGIAPAVAYLRQRYPTLRFEIHVDHTSYELRSMISQAQTSGPSAVVKSSWRAYLRPGVGLQNTNPLVACGSLVDTLDVAAGVPVIAHRRFIVERILAAEHFKPTILPLTAPKTGGDIAGIGAYCKRKLRESNALLSSLLALSALLASINPMLGILLVANPPLASILQLACASVGSVCALLSMVVMLLNKVIALVDQGVAGALEGALSAARSAGGIAGGAEGACVSERELLDGSVFDVQNETFEQLTNAVSSVVDGVDVGKYADSLEGRLGVKDWVSTTKLQAMLDEQKGGQAVRRLAEGIIPVPVK